MAPCKKADDSGNRDEQRMYFIGWRTEIVYPLEKIRMEIDERIQNLFGVGPDVLIVKPIGGRKMYDDEQVGGPVGESGQGAVDQENEGSAMTSGGGPESCRPVANCGPVQSPGVAKDIAFTPQYILFGHALNMLKAGYKASRVGWNGPGQYIVLQRPDEHSKMTLPYIYIRTVTGDLVPWVASQTDLLAEDWFIVE